MRAYREVSLSLFKILIQFFVVINLICNVSVTQGNEGPVAHRKFEYKYSFKPPYLAQKDGSVPFFEYGGNAIASEGSMRLAPSLRSQKGAIWNKHPTNFEWWDVDIAFRVNGRGRIGADGFAFWFTTQKGDYNGPVYGSSDRWNGLGLIFDSFDNDNKHNNPYIMAVLNDGTKDFNHAEDGGNQILAGCSQDFRNKQFLRRARIIYYNNVLTVYYHPGLTNNDKDYELCLRVENVYLPKNAYFGLSAATGDLADDHDVFHLLTTSLHPPGQLPQEPAQTAPETAKLNQEFEAYEEKLKHQKEEYKKEHPDAHIKDGDEWEENFETEDQREYRQIYQAQNAIFEHVRELSRKLDEVIGRQENTLSLVTRSFNAISVIGAQQPGVIPQQPVAAGIPQQQQPVMATGSTITRPEVDLLIANQNILLTTIREIRQLMVDVNSRTETISQRQQAVTGHAQPSAYDAQAVLNEMRDGLNQVKQGISHVSVQLTDKAKPAALTETCPTRNCVGVTLFLGITAAQLLVVVIYIVWKSRSETQAKKFY